MQRRNPILPVSLRPPARPHIRPRLRQAMLLGLLLLLAMPAVPMGADSAVPAGTALTDGLHRLAESDGLALDLDVEEGQFAVTRPADGQVYRSGPEGWEGDPVARGIWKTALHSLMIVEYVTSDGSTQVTDTWSGSVEAGGASYEAVENGFLATYRFPENEFTLALRVTLTNGRLRVIFPTDSLRQEGTDRVTAVSLVPLFGAGGPDEDGGLVVPSGSGGLIRWNNGKSLAGDFIGRLYGEDDAVAPAAHVPVMEPARFPAFGSYSGQSGLLARILSGDALATVRASVSGGRSLHNLAYCQFQLVGSDTFTVVDNTGKDREYLVLDKTPRSLGDLAVEYTFLRMDRPVSYPDLAAEYRRQLLEEHPGLAEGAPPRQDLLLDFYGAVRKRQPFLGIPLSRRVSLTTFGEAADLAATLVEAGIGPLSVQYRFATVGEVDHDPFRSGAILRSLGGVRGLLALQDSLPEGGRVFLSVEPTLLQRRSWLFGGLGQAARGIMGLPVYRPVYNLETNLRDDARRDLLVSPVIGSDWLARNLDRLERQGIPSVSIQSVGDRLYSDYDEKGAVRPAAAALWGEAWSGFGTRDDRMAAGANHSLAILSGSVADVPTAAAPYVILDASIPFLQLSWSGLSTLYSRPVNLSSNPLRSFLSAVETGTLLRFAFIAEETEILRDTELDWLYSAGFDRWIGTVLDYQGRYRALLDRVEGARPVSHALPMEDVARLDYDNGVSVYVNRGSSWRKVDGLLVPPQDFAVLDRGGDAP